jgi:hypothetical protein
MELEKYNERYTYMRAQACSRVQSMLVDVPEGSKLGKVFLLSQENHIQRCIHSSRSMCIFPCRRSTWNFSRSIYDSTWNSSNYEWHTAVLNNGTLPSYYVAHCMHHSKALRQLTHQTCQLILMDWNAHDVSTWNAHDAHGLERLDVEGD